MKLTITERMMNDGLSPVILAQIDALPDDSPTAHDLRKMWTEFQVNGWVRGPSPAGRWTRLERARLAA